MGAGGGENRARLEALIAGLDRQSTSNRRHPNLISNVSDAVLHFEVAHPRVTSILSDVLASPSSVGR